MTDKKQGGQTLNDEVVPVLFDHCCKVYKAMLAEAKGVEDHESQTPSTMVVYEGHLTALVAAIPLSTPYYTSCMRALREMGCVRQLRRGGGSTPSQWEMITEPTVEKFMQLTGQPVKKKVRVGKVEQLENQVRVLTTRLNELDQKVDQLVQGLISQQDQQEGGTQ